MEEGPKNIQESNPFKSDYANRYFLMNGSAFSDFEHGVVEEDRSKFERVVLNQAIEQAVRGIRVYLETKDSGVTAVFSHGLPYYWDIIQASYPEACELLKKIYDGVESLGTDKEINLQEIADRLTGIKTELNLTREEYFEFAEEKGIKREELLKKCIFRLMGPMLPKGSGIHGIIEEWKSLTEASLSEVTGKTRELIVVLSKDSDWHKFRANSNELFLLNQILEDAEEISERRKILESILDEISDNPRAGRLDAAIYKLEKVGELELSQELTVSAQIAMIDLISSDMSFFRNPDTTFLFRNSGLDADIGHEVKKFPDSLTRVEGVRKLRESINNFLEKVNSLAEEKDQSVPEYETKKADMIKAYDEMIGEVEKVRPNYPTVEEIEEKIKGLL